MTQTQTKARVERDGTLAIVRFDGDITSASSDAVLGAYRSLPPEVKEISLDFNKVPYLNSSGIALVIQMVMHANTAGQKVAVFGLTPHFRKVFTMVGLGKYTTIHGDASVPPAKS
jgi:anti-anti-sigma factor